MRLAQQSIVDEHDGRVVAALNRAGQEMMSQHFS